MYHQDFLKVHFHNSVCKSEHKNFLLMFPIQELLLHDQFFKVKHRLDQLVCLFLFFSLNPNFRVPVWVQTFSFKITRFNCQILSILERMSTAKFFSFICRILWISTCHLLLKYSTIMKVIIIKKIHRALLDCSTLCFLLKFFY